jgi:hypothetical protein
MALQKQYQNIDEPFLKIPSPNCKTQKVIENINLINGAYNNILVKICQMTNQRA